MKRFLLCLVVMTFAFMAACGTSSDVKTGADSGSDGNGGGNNGNGGGGGGSAKVGQPITIKGNSDGSQMKVTAARVTNTKSTDGFSTPDKGKRLVAVQFKLVNTGTASYDDAPSNGAVVIDTKGQQYESDIMFQKIAAGPLLPAQTKVPPNGQALGYLVFQVPTNAKVGQVQFSMDSGFGETAQWDVA